MLEVWLLMGRMCVNGKEKEGYCMGCKGLSQLSSRCHLMAKINNN